MSASSGAAGPPFLGPHIAVVGFVALTGAFGLNFAAGQFFAPLTDSRGWDLGTLSAAAGLNTAVSGLAQPPLGRLIDRVGTRPVLATCLALMGAAYVLMASAQTVWQWLVAYGLLAGVGFAGSSSLAVTVLISRWYVRDRARVLPRVFLGINAGQLTLVPLGGFLIERAGYRVAYLVLGLTVLAIVVPLVALRAVSHPERVGQHPDGRPDPRSAPARARPWPTPCTPGRSGWQRWRSASTAGPSTSPCCTCRATPSTWAAASKSEAPFSPSPLLPVG
jgi:MFS family permease